VQVAGALRLESPPRWRGSSVAEQRTHKPLVVSSNLTPATNVTLRDSAAVSAPASLTALATLCGVGDARRHADAARSRKRSKPQPPQASPAHERFLSLQSTAGNAATAAWLQASPDDSLQRQAQPEESWQGSLETNLGENKSLYHTLNNFGDKPLQYLLRIRNTGYTLLNLGTQYTYRGGEPEREWVALFGQRGETREVTNGLSPKSSLRLRLFGERDHTAPDQSHTAGTVEVFLKK
jgi:hypothetical protein